MLALLRFRLWFPSVRDYRPPPPTTAFLLALFLLLAWLALLALYLALRLLQLPFFLVARLARQAPPPTSRVSAPLGHLPDKDPPEL
jgi:hypothetical protein